MGIIIFMIQADPFAQKSKAAYVESELEKMVLSDKYKEGDRLPPQTELAEQFHVGSRIMREALKLLEMKGLVSIEHGRGVFVRKQKLDFYLNSLTESISYELPQNKKILMDLFRTRELIEIQAIRSFIESPDYPGLESLKAIVTEMSTKSSEEYLEEYRKLDLEFHKGLVALMNNDVLNYMFKHLTHLLLFSMKNTQKKITPNSYQEHLDILKALNVGNEEVAIELVRNHFRISMKTIQTMDTDFALD